MGLRTIKANLLSSVFQELIRTPLLVIMPTFRFPSKRWTGGSGMSMGSIYTMGRPLVLYIFLFYWHFLNALFTVEAPQSLYTVEHGSNVTMECTFPVNGKLKFRDLSVSWEKKDELKQVYELVKGEEHFKNQHSDFRGRIKLLKENLNLGQSLLQITHVKLRDAGVYRCVIAYEGADYKTIHLKVKAPYRIINQGVGSTGHNEWKLMCQSEGYPEAKVIWQNRDYDDLTDKANTRYETGSDQLYRVTSTLTIKSGIDEVFYCIFWNKELQENTTGILHIADSADGILQTKSRRFVGTALIATAFVGSGLLFMFCIRKGLQVLLTGCKRPADNPASVRIYLP
uniref:Uncharacterized protein n=1 Tax=Corvus moneduloides TaxID=1196302 RepID=A0A8C3EDS5_CORMO